MTDAKIANDREAQAEKRVEAEAAERLAHCRLAQLKADAKIANDREAQAEKGDEAEAAERLSIAADREKQAEKRIEVERQEAAKKQQPKAPVPEPLGVPVTMLAERNPLGAQGGIYFELAQHLMSEGKTIDAEPNGPCTQALYAVCAAALKGAKLLDLQVTYENHSTRVRYVMTVDIARSGELAGIPGRFYIHKVIPFTLEDKDGHKVLTFLNKSVYFKLGSQEEEKKEEQSIFGAIKSAVKKATSIDLEAQFHFGKDGMVKIPLSIMDVHKLASDLAKSLNDVKWTKV
jgi:hypothetical protein